MSGPDVSILIVHTFEHRLIRQTLRGLRRAAPQMQLEVLVIDNNQTPEVSSMLKTEFPEIRYFVKANQGFGSAMNVGIQHARGKYILIFNPDIILSAGALEQLFAYMEAHPDVGIVGPKLLNADGSLQYSCNRYHELLVPILRRTPLGRLPWGREKVDRFLMKDVSHTETIDVDWLMGSSLFTRSEALAKVGSFDERFFMYFEDTDLCWRFWEAGYKVQYLPAAIMVHYHRRASADGSIFQQLLSSLTWHHIHSAYKFFRKHAGQKNPRELAQLTHSKTGN